MEDMQERIRQRAYEIWMSEGCPSGAEERHWHQAVRDVSEGEVQTDDAAMRNLSGIADAAGDGVLTDGAAPPRPTRAATRIRLT